MPTSQEDNVLTKCDAQKNEHNFQGDKCQKESSTTHPQDELIEAATSRQNLSKQTLPIFNSFMAPGENDKFTPVVKDVRSQQAPPERVTHQEEMIHNQTSIPSSVQTPNVASKPVQQGQKSLNHTQVTPQRPQDLLYNRTSELPRLNVKSSAQYRKSYAFKIWRDKGSFPYRLAEQPRVVGEVVERRKSKKYLNAVRAQKDRENEEKWRVFKSSRSANDDMKYRRTSKLVRAEENLMKEYEKQQLDTILSDPTQDKNHKKQQNSIFDYFKNKKDSAQKSLSSSSIKSIPTSVIHVKTTKAVPKLSTQAEQSKVKFDDTIQNGVDFKSARDTRTSNKRLAGNEDSFSKWSDAQAFSGNFIIAQNQSETNTNYSPQHTRTDTMTGHNVTDSILSVGRKTSLDMQSIQQEHRTSEQHTAATLNQDFSIDNSDIKNAETLASESQHHSTVVSDESSIETTPALFEMNNANLTSIIKNSLTKKYSKENVRPILPSAVVERSRKRRRNESDEEREGGRVKEATVFTRFNESVATNLADGIHNVNSEYFPIQALANKAAKETSRSDELESNVRTTSIKRKLDEIERARLLLKELFDVTSESDADTEMKTFDDASHSFGRKNILNHLSLIDRYFAEFQRKLSTNE